MNLIQKAKQHFNSKETRKRHIPEWNVDVFAKPLNMETKQKWLARAGGSNTDYLIYAVIFGALDSEGNPLFSIEDKKALKTECDADVVSEIATFVLGVDNVPEEVREKNS